LSALVIVYYHAYITKKNKIQQIAFFLRYSFSTQKPDIEEILLLTPDFWRYWIAAVYRFQPCSPGLYFKLLDGRVTAAVLLLLMICVLKYLISSFAVSGYQLPVISYQLSVISYQLSNW